MNIAYLYHDLLNLYGDSGNVLALKKNLEDQKIKVNISYLSINDKLDFSKYDITYIGSGTENNLKIAFEHLKKYKKDIKNNIENNKFFFITGNSIELFGKEYLNIFNYNIVKPGNRLKGETIVKSDFIKQNIIGFQNQENYINNIEYPLFKEIKKIDNYPIDYEGIHYKNFYGTYIIGPILIRNPELLKYIIKTLSNKKLKGLNLTLDKKAYEMYNENKYANNTNK